jgi:hypothetical protein
MYLPLSSLSTTPPSLSSAGRTEHNCHHCHCLTMCLDCGDISSGQEYTLKRKEQSISMNKFINFYGVLQRLRHPFTLIFGPKLALKLPVKCIYYRINYGTDVMKRKLLARTAA